MLDFSLILKLKSRSHMGRRMQKHVQKTIVVLALNTMGSAL